MHVSQTKDRPSWIDEIIRSTRNLEAPERYFWWSAIAAVSAVVRKQVFLNRGGHYKLYPNVYIALISKHSGLRKGVPVALASKLINGVQCTRTIEGRSSIQAVINEFSKQVTLENGRVLNDAQGIMVSGEFDTMLLKDPDALTVLTALYNTHEHNGKWKNTLKGTGVESLLDPCISLLVASNETLFEDAVKQKDVEGGFLARTFVVLEEKRRGINPLIEIDEDIVNSEKLIVGLTEISKVSGEFRWSESAKKLYKPWYEDICNAEIDDRTGAINRLGDSVLKVAMLINLAGSRDLVIHRYDLQLAIDKCQECMTGLRKLTRSLGISELGPVQKRIIDIFVEAPGYMITRIKLLQKIYPDADAGTVDRVLDTLSQSEAIEALRDEKKKIAYRLTPKAFQMFTKFVKEKEKEQ